LKLPLIKIQNKPRIDTNKKTKPQRTLRTQRFSHEWTHRYTKHLE